MYKQKNNEKQKKNNKECEQVKQSGINIVYTNADQFTTSKKDELLKLVAEFHPHIIALCEVKIKNGSERTKLDYEIPGYVLYPTNLFNNTGRGIALYIHTSIDNLVVEVDDEKTCDEYCLLEVKIEKNDTLLFGCIYRSPTKSLTSKENNKNINELLIKISSSKYSHICLVGDFNYKNINWDTWTTQQNESSKEATFIETLRDSFLYQHVLEPTRSRGNDDPSLIDLILTNEEMQVSNPQDKSPLGKSDHSVLTFTYDCYIQPGQKKERRNYLKADFAAMKQNLASTHGEMSSSNPPVV